MGMLGTSVFAGSASQEAEEESTMNEETACILDYEYSCDYSMDMCPLCGAYLYDADKYCDDDDYEDDEPGTIYVVRYVDEPRDYRLDGDDNDD